MSEHQMPPRVWTEATARTCGVWSARKDPGDIAFIRADIAERMAEALEDLLSASEHRLIGSERDSALEARSALSAFKDATGANHE